MRWTSLLVAFIFAGFSYTHFTTGLAFYAFYYLCAAGVALMGFRGQVYFWPTAGLIGFGLGALVTLMPTVSMNEGMFDSDAGREFMVLVLVQVWMASLLVEYLRVYGSPFGGSAPSTNGQEEGELGEDAPNDTLDSEQP